MTNAAVHNTATKIKSFLRLIAFRKERPSLNSIVPHRLCPR
jgi:hypothetical protein